MIETERTFLKAMERDDVQLKASWLNNPTIRETLLLSVPISKAQLEVWYERILNDRSREDFIIWDKNNSVAIGFAGYVNIDFINRKAEPFIAIGNVDFWGKGFGTEVVHKLLDYGFNEMGFNRQYGFVLDNNPAALKMDLKAGFKQEGILKEDVMLHGIFHDRIMLGVTKDIFNKRFNDK